MLEVDRAGPPGAPAAVQLGLLAPVRRADFERRFCAWHRNCKFSWRRLCGGAGLALPSAGGGRVEHDHDVDVLRSRARGRATGARGSRVGRTTTTRGNSSRCIRAHHRQVSGLHLRGHRSGHGVPYDGHSAHAEAGGPDGPAAVLVDHIVARQVLLHPVVVETPGELDDVRLRRPLGR